MENAKTVVKDLIARDQMRFGRHENIQQFCVTDEGAEALKRAGVMTVKLPTLPLSQWFDHSQYPHMVHERGLAAVLSDWANDLKGIQLLPQNPRAAQPSRLDKMLERAKADLAASEAKLRR